MSDDETPPDLFGQFDGDMPDPDLSSAAVAALEAVAMYSDSRPGGRFTKDEEAENKRTVYDVLAEWLRDHDGPLPLIMALLDIAAHFVDVNRLIGGEEQWQEWLVSERTRRGAQDVLTSAAYAEQVGEDEDES